MIRDLLLIKARVLNLLLQIFWQPLKFTSFPVNHYSVFPFWLILQLQLRGITSLLDDGAELALFNGDYVRGPLFLLRAILIIFRLVTLHRLRHNLFTALDHLGQLKNDIRLLSSLFDALDFGLVDLKGLIYLLHLLFLGWHFEYLTPGSGYTFKDTFLV